VLQATIFVGESVGVRRLRMLQADVCTEPIDVVFVLDGSTSTVVGVSTI
jgi:hypothetical protein